MKCQTEDAVISLKHNFYIVPQEPTNRKPAILNGHIFDFGTAYFFKALGYLVYGCLIPSVNMMVCSRYYTKTSLDGLRNNTKNRNLNSRIPYRGSNINSKEFYTRVPVSQTESSLSCFQMEFIA